jgi:hypothetical protein
LRPITQLVRILPWCWHNSTLPWNQTVHQTPGDSLIDFADDSRHASPWAAKVDNDAIARGKRHPRAVRILARAWVRVIWRCWHDNTAHNPQLHGGAMQLQAA